MGVWPSSAPGKRKDGGTVLLATVGGVSYMSTGSSDLVVGETDGSNVSSFSFSVPLSLTLSVRVPSASPSSVQVPSMGASLDENCAPSTEPEGT